MWAELVDQAAAEDALMRAAAWHDPGAVRDRLEERRKKRAGAPEWEPMPERIERLKKQINPGA